MATVQDIIKKEEQKCHPQILENVISYMEDGKTIKDISKLTKLDFFNLSPYIEVAFYKSNIDPSVYVKKELIEQIMSALEGLSYPNLKPVKEKVPNCDYSEIRVVRGVYFRSKRYYKKKTNKKKKVENNQLTLDLDIREKKKVKKVELDSVPYLMDFINSLSTPHWRNFATTLFEYYVPKQFYILPATFHKNQHNESELETGYFDKDNPLKLASMGGKAYHSYRVYKQLLQIIEPDMPEIWDYKKTKVKNYVYGNDYEAWELDVMKVAAWAHDIYSGGPNDELDPKRKRMDKLHPHYHKTELLPIKSMVPDNEWDAFIQCVDNHMWKWQKDPSTLIRFDNGKNFDDKKEVYNFYRLFRMVKNVELADYLASRRNDDTIPRFKQFLKTWYHINENYNLTWDDLNECDFSESDIREAFGKDKDVPLENIIKQITE
ncbi:MAG: helix-turn-helix domain-containing protein [Candidatus Woesearchaeota archaeon]